MIESAQSQFVNDSFKVRDLISIKNIVAFALHCGILPLFAMFKCRSPKFYVFNAKIAYFHFLFKRG